MPSLLTGLNLYTSVRSTFASDRLEYGRRIGAFQCCDVTWEDEGSLQGVDQVQEGFKRQADAGFRTQDRIGMYADCQSGPVDPFWLETT